MTVTPALIILAGLAVSEAVQLELIKLIALLITSVASSYAVYQGHKNRVQNKRLEEKVNKRRKAVRESVDGDQVVIIEERRGGERGNANPSK